jgi:predicted dehydrogenase
MGKPYGRRLRLGMVGGGEGAFIGAVHRMAARLDDQWDLVAGALSSRPEVAHRSAEALGIAPDRSYASYADMARAEAARADGIDAVCMAFLDAGIPVICDKPLTTTVADSRILVQRVKETGLPFFVTQNNTGYAMVRHARELATSGALGELRIVQVSYAQEFLSDMIEDTGLKQATWRTDPAQAGRTATLGDIGVHAFNLAEFVTGQKVSRVAAEVHTFVKGRRLDDNAHAMLHFDGGAKGMLWASQAAPGNNNRLTIEVYGSKASIKWCGEDPDTLIFGEHGKAPQRVVRGGAGSGAMAGRATRMPPGHPEGYVEGFGVLYRDAAHAIRAWGEGKASPDDTSLLPNVISGFRGVAFIDAALNSSAAGVSWVEVPAN